MEWFKKILVGIFSPMPRYNAEPQKHDARTDKERYDDYLKEKGLYIPPEDPATARLKQPKTAAEIKEFMAELRAEFAATTDKIAFFQKYRLFFNCYGYASGGIGNPFVMEAYDTPILITAVPGALAGKPMRFVDEHELDRGVVADGYVPVIPRDQAEKMSGDEKQKVLDAAEKEIRPNQVLVAALIDDRGYRREIHFMVRNQKGQWSDKHSTWLIKNQNSNHSFFSAPHLGMNDRQQLSANGQHGYRFVGYYWRPAEGIPVMADVPPVIGIASEKGGDYRKDAWLSPNTSSVYVDKEVRGWSVKKNPDGSIVLGLEHDHKQQTFVTLPRTSILSVPQNGGEIDYIHIADPSGPSMELQVLPNGKVKAATQDYPDIKRPSPFRK
jgi:hypothetical protein